MINWEKLGNLLVSKEEVEIRSLKIRDESGKIRRLRICTVWKPISLNFTKTPAIGKLGKTKEGCIGVLITGKNMGYVKIGKNFSIQSSIFVPFNCVSKKVLNKLYKGKNLSVEEIDGMVIGFEK